jgi:cell wall-associated NlpC family hydrolase
MFPDEMPRQHSNTEPLTAGIDIRLLPLPATHRTTRRIPRPRLWLIAWLVGLALAFGAGHAAGAATAASASTNPKRLVAFYDARTRAGDPYVYGDAGPNAFDCSGLVQWAYARAGISLPRTTYGMLAAVANGLLQPTTRPVKGDLAFYGSGHVELFVRNGHTFGAHQTGQPVGWIAYGWGWVPTMFFHVRGSG